MVLQFDRHAALYFAPKPHVRWKRLRYVLWPVYVYRVLAPRFRERHVNIVEKAVLGLCRAGKTDPQEISDLLHIHNDLAEFVMQQLVKRDYLDPARDLTAKGKNALENALDFVQDLAVGYVLQDPWTNELWPRFCEKLDYAEVESSSDGYAQIAWGEKGNPRRATSFIPTLAGVLDPRPPAPEDILGAVRRHRRAETSWEQSLVSEEDLDTDEGMTYQPISSIMRVASIYEEPQALFVVTVLYSVEAREQEVISRDWHVSDPFGLDTAPFLRRQIERQRRDDLRLANLIDQKVVDMVIDHTKMQQDWAALQAEATEIIQQRFKTVQMASKPLYPMLIAVERSLLEIRYSSDPPSDKFEDVLMKVGKVLERLFGHMNEKYSTVGTARILPKTDREYQKEWLNALASHLGFNSPLPSGMLYIPGYKIELATERGGGTLGQRAIASLLAARTEQQHPLRLVAVRNPDLLDQLGFIIVSRDRSAHDSGHTFTIEEIQQQAEIAYSIIEQLLPLI